MADDVRQAPAEAGIGPVTFLEAGHDTRRRERVVIGLLGAITGLLLLMVVGLGLGTLWLAHQYDALKAQYAETQGALESQAGDVRQELREAIATTRLLSRDMLMRQATLSRDWKAEIARVEQLQSRLDQRRAAFKQIPKGPFEKADFAIRLAQLTLDEAMVANRHVAATQRVIAKNLALTPSQEKLLRDLDRQVGARPKK